MCFYSLCDLFCTIFTRYVIDGNIGSFCGELFADQCPKTPSYSQLSCLLKELSTYLDPPVTRTFLFFKEYGMFSVLAKDVLD